MDQVRALWEIGWYNTDYSLKVGERDLFAFRRPEDAEPDAGHHLQFDHDLDPENDYRWATVEAIEHRKFGALEAVDTRTTFSYTFRFRDGRWVTIDVEQSQGVVEAASPDFAIDRADPDWGTFEGRDHRRWDQYTGSWDLEVTLSDVVATSFDEMRASRDREV